MKHIVAFLLPVTLVLSSCITDPSVVVQPATSSSSQTGPANSSALASSSALTGSSSSTGWCFSNTGCDSLSYCDYSADTTVVPNCFRATTNDTTTMYCANTLIAPAGTCKVKPQVCPMIYAPVCVNGVTYSNACMAQAAGQGNISTSGVCAVVDTSKLDTTNALLFDRTGGGQLHFFADLKNDSLRVTVTRVNFQASVFSLQIPIDAATQACVSTALKTQILILPPSEEVWDTTTVMETFAIVSDTFTTVTTPVSSSINVSSSSSQNLATGTWFNIYSVHAGIQTTLTSNVSLMSCLSPLETTVRNNLTSVGLYNY